VTDRPNLAAVLADPAAVPAERIPEILGEIERVKGVLWARLAVPPTTNGAGGDRLLTIHEAALRLAVPTGWVKKRPDLPFRVVLSDGTVRYSARGLEAFIRARHGTG